MNYQKDIKNTETHSYGQSSQMSEKLLIDKRVYEYSYKKTEKLVTALYMVTDCMEVEDALKGKIRTLGVDLLSHMHKLSNTTSSPIDNHVSVSTSLLAIDEILSFITIANTIGFISEMNTSILKKELSILSSELKKSQREKDANFTFSLNENMFAVKMEPSRILEDRYVKDKRTQNMSFTSMKASQPTLISKGHSISVINTQSKNDRINKILSIIKDKKNIAGIDTGVSIKDISIEFPDWSEKTIQRELNILALKGQIKKTGAKRWSRYHGV